MASRKAITLLQLLEALECDFKLIGLVEARGVVLDLDTEERDDRHFGRRMCGCAVIAALRLDVSKCRY